MINHMPGSLMPFGPRLKAIQNRVRRKSRARQWSRSISRYQIFFSKWTNSNAYAKLSKATSVKQSLITMQDFNRPFKTQASPKPFTTPKIRNLGNGFVLLTVGPYQETIRPNEIHQTTADLQRRCELNFLPESKNCYILANRKNFLECLHTEAQKLKL